jgi:hypothetical protein
MQRDNFATLDSLLSNAGTGDETALCSGTFSPLKQEKTKHGNASNLGRCPTKRYLSGFGLFSGLVATVDDMPAVSRAACICALMLLPLGMRIAAGKVPRPCPRLLSIPIPLASAVPVVEVDAVCP